MKPSSQVRTDPNYDTGTVNFTVEVKDAPGIKKAYEYALEAVQHIMEIELSGNRLDYAEEKLAQKRKNDEISNH